MEILFNLVGSNLGNNGGSHTIVRSSNILIDLGYKVKLIVDGRNQYTWTDVKSEIIVSRDPNEIPDSDVIIATSFWSVDSTNRCNIKNKFWWIRGWENWTNKESSLVSILKNSPSKKIVNSIGLQNKLKSFNIDSTIVYPGYDFNEIYPLNIRNLDNDIILGGLYNNGKKRSSKRTDWIFKCYQKLKKKYPIKLFMFGIEGSPGNLVDYYIKNPNIEEKNKMYNSINIWLSSSENEGLHLTPAEAMMTECCVVGNSSLLSGTIDYLINQKTGLVSENNFDSFINCVEVLINDKNLREELGRNGREKITSIGSREENMKKMIEVLSG